MNIFRVVEQTVFYLYMPKVILKPLTCAHSPHTVLRSSYIVSHTPPHSKLVVGRKLTVEGMAGGVTGSAYAIFSFRMSSEVSRGILLEVGVGDLSLGGPRGTECFFCTGAPPGVVGDSRVGVEVVGVAELLLGGVVETCNEGTSDLGVVDGGGALVFRIRSTLMFATIRIISMSPTR